MVDWKGSKVFAVKSVCTVLAASESSKLEPYQPQKVRQATRRAVENLYSVLVDFLSVLAL